MTNEATEDPIQISEDDVPSIGLSDEEIQHIEEALHQNDGDTVVHAISNLSAAEAAELYTKVSDEDREQILKDHSTELHPEFYIEIDAPLRKKTLEAMEAQDVARIISDLDSDDALDLILNLEPDFQNEIIRKLSAKTRITLEEGLSFPEDSAGRLMQREFVAVPQFWTVGKTIDYIRAAQNDLPSDFFDVFVIGPTYHVIGEIPLNKLIRAKRSEKMEELCLEVPHAIPAVMDQEHVAQLFRRENLVSAPVVDEEQRLIGVITIDDVVDVIDEEAQEDILRLVGIDNDDIYGEILSTTNSRIRWLFVNLLTAILASVVISLFDATLEKVIALAILMPIVASMGGNAGTQALTVAVRALAARQLSGINALRMIWKETLVGTLNGMAFAFIMGVVAAIWFNDDTLGLIVAAAMAINLVAAGLSGAGIPILLNHFGQDPAISSTVFVTTVTDIIGFLSFLGLAALFLI